MFGLLQNCFLVEKFFGPSGGLKWNSYDQQYGLYPSCPKEGCLGSGYISVVRRIVGFSWHGLVGGCSSLKYLDLSGLLLIRGDGLKNYSTSYELCCKKCNYKFSFSEFASLWESDLFGGGARMIEPSIVLMRRSDLYFPQTLGFKSSSVLSNYFNLSDLDDDNTRVTFCSPKFHYEY